MDPLSISYVKAVVDFCSSLFGSSATMFLTWLSVIHVFQVWDLDRPFEGDADLEILKFDDEEGKQVRVHGCFIV